jgi:PKD repeat protein
MNRVLIIDNWISYNTLSSYRLTFPTKEINSISEDPLFVSSTDLHCNNIKIRGKGTSVSWIKTDFDDQIRDSITPDIGADEFKNDTTKSAVAYFNSQCSGSLSLQLIDSSMRAKNVIWIVNSIDTLWSRNPVYKFITPGIHSVKQVAFDYIGTGFNSITSNVTVSNYERITSHTLDSISISPLHSNYRWFRNGGLVPNGTSNSYKVLFNGTYWAEYADSLGCILTSDSINIILVGSREQSLTKDIVSFYPNPFKNHLTVIIKQNIKVEKYKIIDTQGKTIQIINELKNKEILNLHHLNKGIYFIEIGLDNRIERYKLIKH